MRRLPFKRPTTHYDERIKVLDEKICELINERKKISDNNPGYPPFQYISDWSRKYNIYEDFLKSLFGSLFNEKMYVPIIEPEGFIKNLQVLKSIEIDNRFFSVINIRQYSNCSIIALDVDWDDSENDSIEAHQKYTQFELHISEKYNSRFREGSGGSGHYHFIYVVSPALPDNASGLNLLFKEYNPPYRNNQIGEDILIQL